MKIFISQSGARSREIALALKDWLPFILHYAEPWVSQKDIAAGDRWSVEVGSNLSDSNFGIICLTPENLDSPWILFESGAISKSFSEGAACPYLFNVDFTDLKYPLAQFQGKKADRQSTRELIESINTRAKMPVEQLKLDKLFDTFWPELEAKLSNIKAPQETKTEARQTSEILEDLVQSVRAIEGKFRELGDKVSSQDEQIQSIARFAHENIHIEFSITAVGRIGSLNNGDVFNLYGPITRLIPTICTRADLNQDEYCNTWTLRDLKTNELVFRKDLLGLTRKYAGKPCRLGIEVDIPF